MKYLLCLISLSLIACSSNVKITPEYEVTNPTMIAFLPIQAEVGARESRAKYLQKAITEELRSKGFHVLDADIVSRLCKGDCSNRAALSGKYPINAFVSLNLDSASKTNFILGYYNSISGELLVEDIAGTEIARIEHGESERGGLLFQSGQVVQGIIDQFENFGDSSFNKLADTFARKIISQLPASMYSVDDVESIDVEIRNIDVVKTADSILKICADATPGAEASVVVDRVRSSLREVSQGKYCGRFRFLKSNNNQIGDVFVEARSAFGDAERRKVMVSYKEL